MRAAFRRAISRRFAARVAFVSGPQRDTTDWNVGTRPRLARFRRTAKTKSLRRETRERLPGTRVAVRRVSDDPVDGFGFDRRLVIATIYFRGRAGSGTGFSYFGLARAQNPVFADPAIDAVYGGLARPEPFSSTKAPSAATTYSIAILDPETPTSSASTRLVSRSPGLVRPNLDERASS